MNLKNWLSGATAKLEKAGIDTARLDCLILLEDCSQKDRAQLLAEPELVLGVEQLSMLNKKISRRIKHEPLAYIRGFSEFYGRHFIVNKDVLEPRPETETMIELLKTLPAVTSIIDVGTGSGALAITAKLELPTAEVTATDIDEKCLDVARENSKTLKANIEFVKSNLLNHFAVPKEAVILANLPYVPNDYPINQAASMEPQLAIFGGPDGLDLYRKLFKQAGSTKYVLAEALPFQHQELAKIAQQNNYKLIKSEDFIQVFSS